MVLAAVSRAMTGDEEGEPTISLQGREYYGLSGVLEYLVDMSTDETAPYPYVAIGLKELEDYEQNYTEQGGTQE